MVMGAEMHQWIFVIVTSVPASSRYPLPFTIPSYTIAFWVAVAIWTVPEWIGALKQRAGAEATRRDRGSYAVLVVAVCIGFTLALFLSAYVPEAAIPWHRRSLFFIGIALMLLGVALRWYAIRVLGRYFTREVAVRADQRVVQTGPYRFIRHPAYSGSMMTMLGAGLALGNWAGLAALIVGAAIAYGYRVPLEERALCQAIGQPYRDYMQRTRRFIPFVF
jgi:protein-S-isoprenylcysteine O-methyltransferase Ste14